MGKSKDKSQWGKFVYMPERKAKQRCRSCFWNNYKECGEDWCFWRECIKRGAKGEADSKTEEVC